MNNMTFPQLLMMLNPGAANTTYLQPDQEAMLRNQSISPDTLQGGVQMPNMQALNIEGLLGSILGTGVQNAMEGANVGARGLDTPNERDFLRESFGESYRTKDSEYQKALGKMLGEQAGERDAPINFGVDGLGPALSGYKGGESNRGVPSQREMDTLMQILQTGR